jgi:hypothetical protein
VSRASREAARERIAATPTLPAPETEAEASPSWVGWLMCHDGVNGYRRVKVRIPGDLIGEIAVEEPSGPDLRPQHAMYISAEMMSDRFMMDLHEKESA